MKELTCSNNINSSLTGDIGKKPNLENPVYSNNPSSISSLTGDIGKKPNLENPVYSNNPSSILTDAMGLARASLVSKG